MGRLGRLGKLGYVNFNSLGSINRIEIPHCSRAVGALVKMNGLCRLGSMGKHQCPVKLGIVGYLGALDLIYCIRNVDRLDSIHSIGKHQCPVTYIT